MTAAPASPAAKTELFSYLTIDMTSVSTNSPALPKSGKSSAKALATQTPTATIALNVPPNGHAAAPTTVPGDISAEWQEKRLHLGWRIVLTILLLILVAIFSILLQPGRTASAAPAEQAISDPLVLAFYYT